MVSTKNTNVTRINFTVPEEFKFEIDERAANYGISASEYYRRLIALGLQGDTVLANQGKIIHINANNEKKTLKCKGKYHPLSLLPKLGT